MGITTKFAIATEQGLEMLTQLIRDVSITSLETAPSEKYSRENLIAALNSLSNQFIVVYSDALPVGYACVTATGKRPESLKNEKAVQIADFGLLKPYQQTTIQDVLLKKCLSISTIYSYVWMEIPTESPLIAYLNNHGFHEQTSHLPHNTILLKKI